MDPRVSQRGGEAAPDPRGAPAAREARIDDGPLETLCALVAHELANPLAAIGGNAEFAEATLVEDGGEDESGEAVLEAVRDIRAAVTVMGSFLARVRSLAHREAEALVIADLGAIVDAAVGLLEPRLAARRAVVVLPPRPWPSAPHLPRLLTQALLQVLANAIDAIEPGGTISLAHADLPEHVGVVVDDDGAGIAPEHVARVLEPFFTTKARAPGLGLHAAQSAMREQGGRVEIGARPEGRGARVVLLLPKGGSRAARPAVPTAGTPERR